MVVCKFYLQGRCTFGERCRYEHTDSRAHQSGGYQSPRASGYQGRYQALAQDDDYADSASYNNDRYSGSQRNTDYGGSTRGGGGRRGGYQEQSYNPAGHGGYREQSRDSAGQVALWSKNYRQNDHGQDSGSHNYSSDRGRSDHYADTSRYRYRADNYNQSQSASHDRDPPTQRRRGSHQGEALGDDISIEEILALICEEMDVWEASGMWLYSCFAYMKDVKSFPGLDDLSFDELRWSAYEARQNGTFSEYVSSVAVLDRNYKNKRLELCNLSSIPAQQLSQLFKDLEDKDSGNAFGPPSSFSNPFASAPQGFSAFGGPTAANSAGSGSSTFGSGLFGSTAGNTFDSTRNVFGGGAESAFGGASNVFGGTGTVFGSSTGNVFGATNAPGVGGEITGSFSAGFTVSQVSAFGNVAPNTDTSELRPAPSQTVNLFGSSMPGGVQPSAQTSTSLGPQAAPSSSVTDSVVRIYPVYSLLHELSADQLNEFKAAKFTFGAIPIVPPPKELI